MSGFYRMEVKVISKTGKRQNGAIGENSAQSASAYITASKIDTLSPIDASAYISGNKVETETRLADYTKKKGVLSSDIVLPENAPDRLRDPAVLWSEVDGMAKRSNADLYREWICCFERHLTLEQMESVARQFADSLAAEGMVVQYALHDAKDNGNYHVHFMAPCRGLDTQGNWQNRKVLPRTFQLDKDGKRIPIIDKETGLQKKNKSGRKQWEMEPPVFVDSFNDPRAGNVQRWRQLFADMENQYLVESVNKEEEDWKIKFVNAVRDEEIYMRSTPMILQASDIDDVIRNSKFSRRASREIPVFHKLLEDCAEYPLGRDKSYEMLSQFIHTAKMEEGISKEREISFFIKQKMDDDMTEEDEEA